VSDKILVAYATAAGSTGEVAEAIGQVLRDEGATVDVMRARDVTGVSGYNAVVVGTGIRVGKPYAEAVSFLEAEQATLSQVPVAYFIVCGTLREDTEDARAQARGYVDALIASAPQVKPVDTAVFGGAVDYKRLSFLLRLVMKVIKSTEGDFRDWDAIRTWAIGLRRTLLGA